MDNGHGNGIFYCVAVCSRETYKDCMQIKKLRSNTRPLLPLLPWTRGAIFQEPLEKPQRCKVWAEIGVSPLVPLILRYARNLSKKPQRCNVWAKSDEFPLVLLISGEQDSRLFRHWDLTFSGFPRV